MPRYRIEYSIAAYDDGFVTISAPNEDEALLEFRGMRYDLAFTMDPQDHEFVVESVEQEDD